MSRAAAIPLLLLALLAGAALAWLCWRPAPDPYSLAYAGIAATAVIFPATRSLLARLAARVDRARPARVAVALLLLASAELAHTALSRHDYHGPRTHDEGAYYLQALMLASGRLWAAAPPAPDSIDTFYVLVRPVYASMYPPGTALLHVPGVWVGAPFWITSVALAAACVPAAFLLLRFPFGNALAACGALALLASKQLRIESTLIMSQVPALLLGTLFLAGCAALRSNPSRRLALACGALAGLLAITRPQDALCVVPAGVLLLLPARRLRGVLPLAAAGALPFVALLLIQNAGVTGSPFRLPYWTYMTAMQPTTGFASATGAPARPATLVRQKIDFADSLALDPSTFAPGKRAWAVLLLRLAFAVTGACPSALLALLFPLGLAGLAAASRGRGPGADDAAAVAGAMLLSLALFAATYGSFTYFFPHYVIPQDAAMLAVALASAQAVGRLAPKWAGLARVAVPAMLVALALSALPETNPNAVDDAIVSPLNEIADRVEASLPIRPALLLFAYRGQDFQREPVYNLRSWDLRANDVIRAHDLGPELNQKLFRAYPDREVYVFDRGTRQLRDLGRAEKLAAPAHN